MHDEITPCVWKAGDARHRKPSVGLGYLGAMGNQGIGSDFSEKSLKNADPVLTGV